MCGSGGGRLTRESIEKVVFPPAPSIGINQSGMHEVNDSSISMSELLRHETQTKTEKAECAFYFYCMLCICCMFTFLCKVFCMIMQHV